ncbi:hypothetical protein ACIA5D_34130 [Actinoplanes sp. NPDC051513]|uniref:hypothetical protein n=1 Tax=Actinoplanes sp. NPDC051513 TaxID=3363908 RepID=UPI0037990DA0
MSSIIEFFVAPDPDAAADVIDGGPSDEYETASYGNFDVLSTIEEWEQILTGGYTGGAEVVAGGDDEPLVLLIPPAVTAALAAASGGELADVTDQWLDLRAEAGEEIDEELAAELLAEVAALATEAVRAGASLYCWVS